MKQLKEIFAQIIAGEPLGPTGLLVTAILVLLVIVGMSWIVTASVNFYGARRYQDAEQRRRFLEGDE